MKNRFGKLAGMIIVSLKLKRDDCSCKDQFDRDDYGTKEMSEQTVLGRKKGGSQNKNRRKEKV